MACKLLRKTQSTSGDIEAIEEPDVKFKGISSRPSFKNAIHQSLASQTQNTTAVIYTVQEYYDGTITHSEFSARSEANLKIQIIICFR